MRSPATGDRHATQDQEKPAAEPVAERPTRPAGPRAAWSAGEAARQRRAMLREMEKTTLAFWSSALKPLAPRKRVARKPAKNRAR